MSAITHRAFSRNANKTAIHFTESMSVEYRKGELINKSTGGMSFTTEHELKPGCDILIRTPELPPDPSGATPHPDLLAEVRWCMKEKNQKTASFRVGVRLFSSSCMICEKEIHHHADNIDLCEDCRGRFCTMSKGKIKTCVEKYLLGNVI